MHRRTALASIATIAHHAASLGQQVQRQAIDVPYKIFFAYVGTVGRFGWNFAHERSRRHLAAEFRDRIQTFSVENVPEGIAGLALFRRMVQEGARTVVGTTYGFRDALIEASREFPDVQFLHCTGLETKSNLSVYAAKTWESAFLAGTLAAEMSRSAVLGVVGSVPIPEVLRSINAFTLGARKARPRVRVRLLWTGSWWDPSTEASVAASLLADGADCIFPTTNSAAPLLTAERNGAFAFGIDSDMSAISEKAHLASGVIDWAHYYSAAVRGALGDGTLAPRAILGLREAAVDLVSIAKFVPPSTRSVVLELKSQLSAGDVSVWSGPLRTRAGTLVVDTGSTLSWNNLERIDWLVDGVDGAIPLSR